MIKKNFIVKGMTCNSCEKIIARKVLILDGVKNLDIDYATEKAEVVYDSDKISFAEIKKTIEENGYIIEENLTKKKDWLGWTFAAVGLLLIVYFAWIFYGTIELPQISQNISYGLLFLVGLLTGFHCIGMCGGFVVSYVTKGVKECKKPYQLHLSYATGKIISYTVIGTLFGLLGSIIAFTPMIRGIVGILAGLFLITFGLKMLNLFPALRKFNLRMPSFVNRFIGEELRVHKSSPLVIGLLNGLMIACGPLQAIYIMAAGTGSMLEGAKMLFVFALGTLPVMLGFGYITSIISKKATYKILRTSGIIVIILGLVMINRGLALTGIGYDFNSFITGFFSLSSDDQNTVDSMPVLKNGYQEIRMEVNRYGWKPDKFILKKGFPVKWIIEGKEINGCNNVIQVPKLGLKFDIKSGEQTIEFTPTEAGIISWSCWMGMIPGIFIVKDDIREQENLDTINIPKGRSCGGSCGSSICGAARGGSCGCVA